MAKDSIRDFSATAGSNTDIQSVNIDENCPASGINNAIRELMVDLKNVSTGAVNLETPAADQLNVDNIRIDGNTISSTDTNGDITLDPNGTGDVIVASGNVGIGTSPSVALHVKAGSGQIRLHEGNAADNKYGEIEVSNGKLILHSDKANVENSSTMQFHLDNIEYARFIDNGMLIIGGTSAAINGDSKLGIHGRIDASASGTTPLSLNRSGSDGVIIDFLNDGTAGIGNVSVSGSNVAFNTSSDYRLKENVTDMTGAIDRVKALLPKRFNFIQDADKVFDGFIAHEAQAVVPEAVTGTKDEVDDDGNAVMQGIDQSKLVPLLTGALQEAIAKIETLETQRADLEARLTALEA